MTTSTIQRTTYDAVVIGARCAGAATAMLLARQGLRVLAIDRGKYGTDTLSTHALMRPAVLQMARWGLLDRLKAAGTPAVRTTTFHYGDETIPVPIKDRDGVDALYAPRRTVLDALLVDAAREDGAEIVHEAKLLDLRKDAAGRVVGVRVEDREGTMREIDAGIVIGADGRRSSVARMAAAETYRRARHHTGVVYGYFRGIEVDGYHWYYRPGVSAGVIPTNDGAVNVFVSMPADRYENEIRRDPAAGFARVLRDCDAGLAEAVGNGTRIGKFYATHGEDGYFRRCHGPGWALVGDAGYFKDPLTAHGITDALRDAEFLARAVVRGTDNALRVYQAVRDELSLSFFEATDAIASFRWDLDELKARHKRMSKEMNREATAILNLGDGGILRRSA